MNLITRSHTPYRKKSPYALLLKRKTIKPCFREAHLWNNKRSGLGKARTFILYPSIQERIGASAVILSPIASKEAPRYRGEEEVCKETNTYLRIFGKPYTKLNRRMGVVVCYAPNGSDLDALRDKCKAAAAKVEVY